ncbi:MAG: M48 family metallopeptidase [Deltaproteobacteria bacterium]|nr:M48 family metallopeptidase [Deltaproteobacteria bacterium]
MEDFFFKLGRKAGSGLRKGKWILASLTAGEVEALEAEYQAGCDLARAFDRRSRVDEDARSREFLAGIRARLCERLTNKQRRWRVVSTQTEEVGAFALPGGFLYLTRPLLEMCRFDEDEVACVVGHEMGHVVHGHAMERITSQFLTSAAVRAARIPGGALTQWILGTGINLFHSAYSQDRELEADEFGARLAAAAGYDPRGAIRALERLREAEEHDGLPLSEYFSSHPPIDIRIERLRGLIRD